MTPANRFNWRDHPVLHLPAFSRHSMAIGQQPYIIATYPVSSAYPDNLHWHEGLEIGLILDGTGYSIVEGEEYRFAPGQIHVRGSYVSHMDYADDTAHIFNVHFHPDLVHDPVFSGIDQIAADVFGEKSDPLRSVIYPHEAHTRRIADLLLAIRDEHAAQGYGWPLMTKGLILQIVSILARHYRAAHGDGRAGWRRRALLARLTPALMLIETHLIEPPPIDVLAASVSMSAAWFSTSFRQLTGHSPVAYRNALRIRQARGLLATTDASIGQIAADCGFETVRQFNRLFLRIVGTTPTAYRLSIAGDSHP